MHQDVKSRLEDPNVRAELARRSARKCPHYKSCIAYPMICAAHQLKSASSAATAAVLAAAANALAADAAVVLLLHITIGPLHSSNTV